MEVTRERKRIPREERVKLTVETTEWLHRQLKAEAARRGMSMREHVTGLLERGSREEMEER